MLPAEWLPIILSGAFNEIYVTDHTGMHLKYANQAACTNLRYKTDEVIGMPLANIAPELAQRPLKTMPHSVECTASDLPSVKCRLARKDGSDYPVELRLFRCGKVRASAWIIIARENTHSSQQLELPLPQFGDITLNMPGLVYQSSLHPDGTFSFNYLSDGCHALLGMAAEQLREKPAIFLDLILPDDRASFIESMDTSLHDRKEWNWEGRIWVEEWKDIKWINLRATPHNMLDGSMRWNGIMTNITQGKLEEIEIKQSRARLAELSAHIEYVKEQERTRIAREVHDDLGGNLTAIKMALALLSSRLPLGNKVLLEKAAYVDLLVDRTIESAHRIASDLRPGILDFGIVAALEWQSEEFTRQIGIPCDFATNVREIDLHPDQATAIFRIFQEALTNIAKHAHASLVKVQLSRTKSAISLKIIDNGKGIAAVERLKPQSFGIRGMTERASSLGGKLSISTTKGGGSTITISLPQSAEKRNPLQ